MSDEGRPSGSINPPTHPNLLIMPPRPQEESPTTVDDRLETERSRLIRDSIYLFSAGTAICLVIFWVLAPTERGFLAVGFLPFILLFALALVLVHRGAPQASALTVVVGVTVLQGLSSLVLPSQAPEALVSMLNLLLFAGFTLGPVAAIVVSLIATAGAVTVLYLFPLGWNSEALLQIPPALPLDALSNASLLTTTLTTGGLVALTVHHVIRARQRESQALLKVGEMKKLEAIGRLSAGLAHDFNNLLATIVGSAELGRLHLERGQSPESELSRIEVASRRGADLISKLLSFAQPGSLKPERFDLVQHFRLLAPDLPGNSPDTDVLRIQLPDTPLWVRSRPIEIEQVVFNLLWNALEAGPSPSRIEFNIDRAKAPVSMNTPSAIRIRVRDEGCGMTPETLSRIFEPFFTTRSDTGGHGLGLAVSYGLVQNNGGAIEVSSAPQRGSCFDVWLPEADVPEGFTAQSVEPPIARPEPKGATGGPKCRILVVEDNKDVREVVVALLQDCDFAVESATSGAEAIQTLERGTDFGLLVSDVVMPELGGIELLRELRARRNKVPVLLMSGFSPHNIEDPTLLQPFAMLAKPFSGRALLETIDGLIKSSNRGSVPPSG